MSESYGQNFEASGNLNDWPANVPGKPTQAAVFGAYHSIRGKVFEVLWTGKFPDLETAMYWAAKKEIQAVRKDRWTLASRILWQHDLTAEQAVEAARKVMQPQFDAAIRQIEGFFETGEIDLGAGPMKPVNPSKTCGYYVEVVDKNDPHGEPIASFLADPPVEPPPRALESEN